MRQAFIFTSNPLCQFATIKSVPDLAWKYQTFFSQTQKNWAAANGGVTNGGLRGVWPPFPEIGRNRPFSPFFCLFRPFPDCAKSTWKIQKTEEKGLFPQISSDFLKPPSLKPPFAALQKNPRVRKIRVRNSGDLKLKSCCPHPLPENRLPENGGLDPSWLDFAFFARPDFPRGFAVYCRDWGSEGLLFFRKILVSVECLSAILGPEMGASIFWAPGKMRSFCRKTYVHKIPRFRGGDFGFGGGGGGGVPILFLWARGFF